MRDTCRKVTRYLVLALAASPAAARAEEPHVHGVSRINVAVEGRSAIVELFIPAASVYGFEHEPRNPKEQKDRKLALKRLEENVDRVLIFERDAGCRPSSIKVGLAPQHDSERNRAAHGHHAEVFSEFALDCDVNLAGRRVRIGIFALFPSIEQVTAVVLSEITQQQTRIKDAETRLTL